MATKKVFAPRSNLADKAACEKKPFILFMPREMIEYFFSFLTYENISDLRLVCKKFDGISKYVLNKGFNRVDRYHSLCQRELKAKLPRRESERRNHPLSRHSDILAAIETRLSLLSMTYSKYIDISFCCFIPGKVLDEIFRVLRYVQQTPKVPRAHELLQELRDISSMAIEHFDERILPDLKRKHSPLDLVIKNCPGPSPSGGGGGSGTSAAFYPEGPSTEGALKQELASRIQAHLRAHVKKELGEYRARLSAQERRVHQLEGKLAEQGRKLAEHDLVFKDLLAEIGKLKRDKGGGPPAPQLEGVAGCSGGLEGVELPPTPARGKKRGASRQVKPAAALGKRPKTSKQEH